MVQAPIEEPWRSGRTVGLIVIDDADDSPFTALSAA